MGVSFWQRLGIGNSNDNKPSLNRANGAQKTMGEWVNPQSPPAIYPPPTVKVKHSHDLLSLPKARIHPVGFQIKQVTAGAPTEITVGDFVYEDLRILGTKTVEYENGDSKVKLKGTGKFGQVFFGKYKNDEEVAIKIVNYTESMHKKIESEIQIQSALNHPGICRLYRSGLVRDDKNAPTHIVMVMEKIESVDMADLAVNLSVSQFCDIAIQITEAIQYMHQKGYLYNDIKPDNIIPYQEGEEIKIKLIDLGLSSEFGSEEKCGSHGHLAPELLTDTPLNTTKTDAFALGILLRIFFQQIDCLSNFVYDTDHEAGVAAPFFPFEDEDLEKGKAEEWSTPISKDKKKFELIKIITQAGGEEIAETLATKYLDASLTRKQKIENFRDAIQGCTGIKHKKTLIRKCSRLIRGDRKLNKMESIIHGLLKTNPEDRLSIDEALAQLKKIKRN